MRRERLQTIVGLVAALAAGSSCGEVARTGSSPVYLIIDQLTGARGGTTSGTPSGTLASDVITNVTSPEPCSPKTPCPTVFSDSGQAQFRVAPRDVTTSGTPTAPTTNSDVTIRRYRVSYRRADGRNTPGVDVPYGFDGAVTGTVRCCGPQQTFGFELVRNVAKEEPPLVQLISSATIITTIADVTFYGHDQVGNSVNAVGSIQIDFGNFGDQ